MESVDAKNWLNGNELSYTIWNNKYRFNNESFTEWLNRVSNGDDYIAQLILDKKFIFGGRTLSNRGCRDGSYSNCYSIGYVPDHLRDIMDVNTKIAMTYKAQGGQGLSLSRIRPKGTKVGEYYESDGIIPFMKMFDQTTSSISQGGSRKGALLMSIDVWHKDAEAFITIKSKETEINKANLSLEIDDDFMKDVITGYETGKSVIRHIEREYSGHKIEYDVDTLALYKLICKNARDFAEPGIIFTNRFRNYNIMQYDPNYQIETCNPCGEQPLPKHGACNLCSINLSEYVLDPYTSSAKIDYEGLWKDIPRIVRAMDDVLEENLSRHALPEQRQMAETYRNIGIGIMGLADVFVKMGYKYGDANSIGLTSNLIKNIFRRAVFSSVALAEERGNFPGYSEVVWDSDIMKNSFSEIELDELKHNNKLRNCSLLSIAPTGSIGTMFDVSTGVEPFFMLSYTRKTESLNKEGDTYYSVDVKAVDDYKKITGNTELPDYFISSADINWKNRIAIQSVLQDYVDTAISSTINLPKTTTPEDVEKIYIEAWKEGLKGVTIYVEGTRMPILSKDAPIKTNGNVLKRPKELEADFYQIKVKGEQFVVVVGLLNDKPYEIFAFRPNMVLNLPQHKGKIVKVKKMHYSFISDLITIQNLVVSNVEERAATLYSSMLLRHGVDIEYIIKTAKKVNDNISSFSSAICRILAKYIKSSETGEKCPECGAETVKTGGCTSCPNCGWSKCS